MVVNAQKTTVVEVAETQKITSEKRQPNQQFGWDVDIDKDFIIVGSPSYSTLKQKNVGKVELFKKNNTGFEFHSKILPQLIYRDINYGRAVEIDNAIIAISSAKNSVSLQNDITINSGMIDVFNFKNNILKRQTLLTFKEATKAYGRRLSLSNNLLITKLPPLKNEFESKVLIYKVNDRNTRIYKEITINSTDVELFGQELDISKNRIIVSANNQVFIYEIKQDTIIQEAILKQDKTLNFGNAVAISGNYAFVTCTSKIPSYFGREVPKSDSIITILKQDENGSMKTIFEPYTSEFNYGNKTILGSPTHILDSAQAFAKMEETQAEKMFVYKRTNGKWKLYQELTSNKRTPFEFFGNNIDIKDSLCVVGAFSSPITYEFNNMNAYAGAAYVFKLGSDGYWSLTKKLVPSKREYWTKFGFSVATDGKSVVVGSRFDKTDLDGLNSLENAGAVYYYEFK